MAAALAGAVVPAVAVNIDPSTYNVLAESDVGAYNDWLATCTNVTAGVGTCGSASAPLDSDTTLFFWDSAGDSDNSVIQAQWTDPAKSVPITQVRISTPLSATELIGVPGGPSDLQTTTGTNVSFAAGEASQGQGVFLAYGRNVYDGTLDPGDLIGPNDFLATNAAVQPAFISFQFGVTMPGRAQQSRLHQTNPFQYYNPLGADTAVPDALKPDNVDLTIGIGDAVQLQQGQSVEVELFAVGGFDPNGQPQIPGDVPVGISDDLAIEFLTEVLDVTQGVGDLTFSPTRAGTVNGDKVSLTATSDGTASTELDGQFDAFAESAIKVQGSPAATPFTLAAPGTSGDSTDRVYELDASGIALTLDDAGKTGDDFKSSGAQAVRHTGLAAADVVYNRTIQGEVVGPVLGVEGKMNPDDPAATLEYGSTINLSTITDPVDAKACNQGSVGGCPTLELAIGNLFGEALGDLTSLSIRNIALGGPGAAFFNLFADDCSSGTDYTESGVLTQGDATGGFDFPGLCVTFTPPASDPGTGTADLSGVAATVDRQFTATLTLFSDMNREFETFNDGESTTLYNLSAWARYSSPSTAPLPAPLALLAAGLVGLAGVRARLGQRSHTRADN